MFEWILCLVLSVVSFALFFFFGQKQRRKSPEEHTRFHYYFRFHYYLILGVYISAFFLLLPVQFLKLSKAGINSLHTFFSSLVYSLQMFTVNADYNGILSEIEFPSSCIKCIHNALLTIDFVAAPILTLTTVLSLFRNLTDEFKFWRRRNRDTYVFSELNEQSLALAKSIYARDSKACLVFAGVKTDYESDVQNPLIREVEGIGGLRLKTEIMSLGLKNRKPLVHLDIYLISKNESENVMQAVTLKEQLNKREKCRIFVFSTRPECEYLIAEKPDQESAETQENKEFQEISENQESEKAQTITVSWKPKDNQMQEEAQKGAEAQKNNDDRFLIRKINPILSLVYRNLYDKGYQLLFDQASVKSSKKISVILVGLGQYGLEMLKALPWFCQMEGYEFEINAFDKDKNAQKKIEAECPELFKAQDDSKEAVPTYNINIHPETDTDSADFSKALVKIGNPTYVLVALGDDAQNIRTAINIRILYSQKNLRPKIQTIVYNSEESKVLSQNDSFKEGSNHFDIEFIGDMNSSCKEDVLINSELEHDGLSIHREYSPDQIDSFYTSDYNYRSSCASAIHTRVVASFLKEYQIDQDLLKTVESWLKAAFHFSDQTKKYEPKTDHQSDFIDKLMTWAKKMFSFFVEEQAEIETFTFAKWIHNNKSLKHSINPVSLKKLNNLSFESVAAGKYHYFKNHHETIEEEKKTSKVEKDYDFPDIVSEIEQRDGLYKPEEVFAYILLAMKLMKLEHKRWCAYMRTEGFRYNTQKNTACKCIRT